MEIGNQNNLKQKKRRKNARVRIALFLFVLALMAVSFWSSRWVRMKGYEGLWDFVSTVSSNYLDSRKANPESISIEIREKDFKKLEKNRQRALERGIIVNDIDGDYVSAVIDYNGKKLDAKLRLKGHMTDHLQDNKWSFRVKMKDNDTFMGMKRFSIQHPGTRGYIYEWIYHELMKREGIIALRYKFINVTVNGRDWGIYAVEENFEKELLENNGRVKGPIVRFNPDLYWVNRLNEYYSRNSYDEFASYYSANPEAYREEQVLADSTQRQYYMKALALIEGLRSRKIPVSKAFDIPRLAKFHAIIDLVGGSHSIDWSDIKYYYNPVTELLEPVAYESFTNLESRDVSGQYKYVIPDSFSNYPDWHTMIFSDPKFFSLYVKELERVSEPGFLDDFFSSSNEALQENLAIIYKEFPYKKFDKSAYYTRQKMIRHILEPPKALHAYYKGFEKNKILLSLAPIDALPVEVTGIKVDGKSSVAVSYILPAKQPNVCAAYETYEFDMKHDMNGWPGIADSVEVEYAILGSSTRTTAKVFPFPHTDGEFIADELVNKNGNLGEFPFLKVDEPGKIISVQPGDYVIDKDLIVPEGYTMLVPGAVKFDVRAHAKILSYSPLRFSGTEEGQIVVESSDSSALGIVLIQAGRSVFRNTVFKGFGHTDDRQWSKAGGIRLYESPAAFEYCSFVGFSSDDAINIVRSEYSFEGCLFSRMHRDALRINYSPGKIKQCSFEESGGDALDLTMSSAELWSVTINHAGSKGINVKAGSAVTGGGIKSRSSGIAISAENSCTVDLSDVVLENSSIGVAAFKTKKGGGYPVVKLNGLVLKEIQTKYLKEKKAIIISNGSEIAEETVEVEDVIKNAKKADQ